MIGGSGAALLKGGGFFSDGVVCSLAMGRGKSVATQARKPSFMSDQLEWKQSFKFPVYAISDSCTLTCTTGKTFIGRTSINMSSLPLNKEVEKYYQLYSADGEPVQGVCVLRLKVSIEGVSVVRLLLFSCSPRMH